MSPTRRLSTEVHSIVWAIGDQAVVSGGSFAISIVLARALGPEGFALWAAIWIAVFVALEFQLALAVVPLQVYTHEARERGDDGFVGRVLTLALVFLVVMAGLGLLLALAAEAYGWTGVAAAAVAAAAFGVPFLACEFVRKLLFFEERGRLALLLDALRFGAMFSIALAVAADADGAFDFAFAAGAACLAVLVVGVIASGVRPNLSPVALWTTVRGYWGYSRWLVLLAGSRRAGFDLVYVFSGSALGFAAVGGLRILHQILSVSHVALQTMQNVVPGLAARKLLADGPRGLARFTMLLALVTFPAAIALMLATTLLDEVLVVGLFGPEYAEYASALPVLAAGYAAIIAAYPFMFQLQAQRDSAALLVASLVASFVALASFYPLVQSFGLHGAAMTFSLNLVVEAVLLTGFAARGYGAVLGGREP